MDSTIKALHKNIAEWMAGPTGAVLVHVLLILAVLFLVLYKCIPNRKASFKSQCPGALISSLAWSIFSLAFSMYLDIALAASNMYGSLTMIVFIMIWMYFCMWILLIGAEINAYFEDKLRKLQNAAIEHFMENKETNKEAGK